MQLAILAIRLKLKENRICFRKFRLLRLHRPLESSLLYTGNGFLLFTSLSCIPPLLQFQGLRGFFSFTFFQHVKEFCQWRSINSFCLIWIVSSALEGICCKQIFEMKRKRSVGSQVWAEWHTVMSVPRFSFLWQEKLGLEGMEAVLLTALSECYSTLFCVCVLFFSPVHTHTFCCH